MSQVRLVKNDAPAMSPDGGLLHRLPRTGIGDPQAGDQFNGHRIERRARQDACLDFERHLAPALALSNYDPLPADIVLTRQSRYAQKT
jgi:hypothetical protein